MSGAEGQKFTRPLPAAVTYDLSVPEEATITLPRGSTWTSGPHWHERHTEFLQVLSGRAEIMLSGRILPSVGSEDGIVTAPRGAIHEWRRSKAGASVDGGPDADVDLVIREWTDPRDGQKELFFTALNRRILEAVNAGPGSWKMRTLDLQLMDIFRRLDNHPAFLGLAWPGWMQGAATGAILGGAAVLNWILGVKGIQE